VNQKILKISNTIESYYRFRRESLDKYGITISEFKSVCGDKPTQDLDSLIVLLEEVYEI
jgi:hypothetical protein